ncbi:MAG TPA: radical SAM protein [Spirochaetia bacterium]|nr:radical SAM protein [Spirochaetia bacterium]
MAVLAQVRSILHRLRDGALYLPNPTFANPAWEDARPRVLILRLSCFRDVARSSTHVLLAREIRASLPHAWIDMAFLPLRSDGLEMEAAGLPLILGTQSLRPLRDFDLVLVSNSYLLEQVNLPFLLRRSGVPVWSSQRDEGWPILVLGGSNASAAHGLVSDSGDSVVDAIFFGEGEGKVGALAQALVGAGAKGERLRRAARAAEGLWVAGPSEGAVRSVCPSEAALAGAHLGPVLPGPEAATARLAITLGCPCLCSFCFEGHDRKPFRQIPLDRIVTAARELKRSTGAITLEVESFNFNTHRELPEILLSLNRLFFRVNLMSQRADILADDPLLLDLEMASDKHSFTLGIEGISERQRAFLHKSLEEPRIRRVLEECASRRIREIKLFYLLTGRETEEDFLEFSGLLKWLKDLQGRAVSRPRILFSFGMLVRMPFTPLRHDPAVLDERLWKGIAGRAKSLCQTNGFEFRLALPWSTYAATQALASADSAGASTLVQAIAGHGPLIDDSLDEEEERTVREWLTRHADELGSGKPLGFPFPFPFLDTEREQDRLYRQYEDARAGRDRGYHGRDVAERGSLRPSIEALQGLIHAKRRLQPLRVVARVPREAAGMGREWTDAWLCRRLLELHPELLDNVLCVRESLIASLPSFGERTPWFGESIAEVMAWDPEALARVLGAAVGGFHELTEAEALEKLRLRVSLPASGAKDAPSGLAAFLRDHHGPVTLRRKGDSVELMASAKAIQKRLLLAGTAWRTTAASNALEEAGDLWVLELVIGTRFPLAEWLAVCCGPGADRTALVEVLSISPWDRRPGASSR